MRPRYFLVGGLLLLVLTFVPTVSSAYSIQVPVTLTNGKLPSDWAHCTITSPVPAPTSGSHVVTLNCPDTSPSGQGGQGLDPQQLQQMLQQALQQGQTLSMSAKANAMCDPVKPECPCRTEKDFWGNCTRPSANKHRCEVGICYDQPVPGFFVRGTCIEQNKCLALKFDNLQGQSQSVEGMAGNIVGQIFKGLLDKIMGGGGAGAGGTGTPAGSTGCTQYYTVTVPSTDPCANYVPPVSGSLFTPVDPNVSQQLLDALSSGSSGSQSTPSSVSDQIISQLQEVGTSGGQTEERGTQTSTQVPSFGPVAMLQSGTRGDIQITGSGATIYAGARDIQAGTEVAGFYGADTYTGSQPQGLIARMCQSRPWASSFVSYIIPPTFFDGLCSWRGYQVGIPVPPAPTPTVIIQQAPPAPVVPTSTASTPPTVPPEVDIWAVPATVPLGARTSIFWNTKGVTSCTIKSPDGSFSENTLSGGAATVPITGATVFTISCLTPSGQAVTDYTTVNLAI